MLKHKANDKFPYISQSERNRRKEVYNIYKDKYIKYRTTNQENKTRKLSKGFK